MPRNEKRCECYEYHDPDIECDCACHDDDPCECYRYHEPGKKCDCECHD